MTAGVVILTHLARPSIWAPVLPALSDHRVEFVDVPGFGAQPAPQQPSIPTMAEGLCDRVAGKHVVGVSVAATVALELAKAGGPRSVSAISPAFFWTRSEFARTLSEVGSLWLSVRATPPLVRVAGRSEALRAQVWRRIVAHPDRVPRDVADETVLGIVDNMRHLVTGPRALAALARSFDRYEPPASPTATPLTVVWGDRDVFTPYATQAPRARAALPDARHITLSGCGHLPFFDDPVQVGAMLREATGKN